MKQQLYSSLYCSKHKDVEQKEKSVAKSTAKCQVVVRGKLCAKRLSCTCKFCGKEGISFSNFCIHSCSGVVIERKKKKESPKRKRFQNDNIDGSCSIKLKELKKHGKNKLIIDSSSSEKLNKMINNCESSLNNNENENLNNENNNNNINSKNNNNDNYGNDTDKNNNKNNYNNELIQDINKSNANSNGNKNDNEIIQDNNNNSISENDEKDLFNNNENFNNKNDNYGINNNENSGNNNKDINANELNQVNNIKNENNNDNGINESSRDNNIKNNENNESILDKENENNDESELNNNQNNSNDIRNSNNNNDSVILIKMDNNNCNNNNNSIINNTDKINNNSNKNNDMKEKSVNIGINQFNFIIKKINCRGFYKKNEFGILFNNNNEILDKDGALIGYCINNRIISYNCNSNSNFCSSCRKLYDYLINFLKSFKNKKLHEIEFSKIKNYPMIIKEKFNELQTFYKLHYDKNEENGNNKTTIEKVIKIIENEKEKEKNKLITLSYENIIYRIKNINRNEYGIRYPIYLKRIYSIVRYYSGKRLFHLFDSKHPFFPLPSFRSTIMWKPPTIDEFTYNLDEIKSVLNGAISKFNYSKKNPLVFLISFDGIHIRKSIERVGNKIYGLSNGIMDVNEFEKLNYLNMASQIIHYVLVSTDSNINITIKISSENSDLHDNLKRISDIVNQVGDWTKVIGSISDGEHDSYELEKQMKMYYEDWIHVYDYVHLMKCIRNSILNNFISDENSTINIQNLLYISIENENSYQLLKKEDVVVTDIMCFENVENICSDNVLEVLNHYIEDLEKLNSIEISNQLNNQNKSNELKKKNEIKNQDKKNNLNELNNKNDNSKHLNSKNINLNNFNNQSEIKKQDNNYKLNELNEQNQNQNKNDNVNELNNKNNNNNNSNNGADNNNNNNNNNLNNHNQNQKFLKNNKSMQENDNLRNNQHVNIKNKYTNLFERKKNMDDIKIEELNELSESEFDEYVNNLTVKKLSVQEKLSLAKSTYNFLSNLNIIGKTMKFNSGNAIENLENSVNYFKKTSMNKITINNIIHFSNSIKRLINHHSRNNIELKLNCITSNVNELQFSIIRHKYPKPSHLDICRSITSSSYIFNIITASEDIRGFPLGKTKLNKYYNNFNYNTNYIPSPPSKHHNNNKESDDDTLLKKIDLRIREANDNLKSIPIRQIEKKVHNDLFACLLCAKIYNKVGSLTNHLFSVHKLKENRVKKLVKLSSTINCLDLSLKQAIIRKERNKSIGLIKHSTILSQVKNENVIIEWNWENLTLTSTCFIIDFETTGFTKYDSPLPVTQVSIFDIKNNTVYSQYSDPEFNIDSKATILNNLTNEKLSNEIKNKELFMKINELLPSNSILIAHNSHFEERIIKGNYESYGIEKENYKYISTYNDKILLYKSMKNICDHYNLSYKGAHLSHIDVVLLFDALLKKYECVDNIIDVCRNEFNSVSTKKYRKKKKFKQTLLNKIPTNKINLNDSLQNNSIEINESNNSLSNESIENNCFLVDEEYESEDEMNKNLLKNNKKLRKQLKNFKGHHVIIESNYSHLTKEDIFLIFDDGKMINGRIVDFFLNFYNEKKLTLLSSMFSQEVNDNYENRIKKYLNNDKKSFTFPIYVPICYDEHWFLIEYGEKESFIYNSIEISQRHLSIDGKIKKHLYQNPFHINSIMKLTEQQEDGVSCGYFVITYFYNIVNGKDCSMKTIREKIRNYIENKIKITCK
jgi:hypothetical protein